MSTVLFLLMFFGLLAAGMPIFLVLGACAAILFVVSGQPLIGVAQVVADQLKKRGKTVHLAVVSASEMWGGILNAAVKLQCKTIVIGRSAKLTLAEQAREIGLAWEQLEDPRPQFNLEIFTPGGEREYFLLGPHAPNLTANEVRLVHRLWLRFSDLVAPDVIHHHDVVHFALDEVLNELQEGKESDVVARLKEHINHNKAGKPNST